MARQQPETAVATDIAAKPTRWPCDYCGVPVVGRRAGTKFCSQRCRFAAWERQHPRVRRIKGAPAKDKQWRPRLSAETYAALGCIAARYGKDRSHTAQDLILAAYRGEAWRYLLNGGDAQPGRPDTKDGLATTAVSLSG